MSHSLILLPQLPKVFDVGHTMVALHDVAKSVTSKQEENILTECDTVHYTAAIFILNGMVWDGLPPVVDIP